MAMNGLLAAQEITRALLPEDEVDKWMQAFARSDFAQFPEQKGVGIFPFTRRNLGPISYDLTIGAEAFSLRSVTSIAIPEGEALRLAPGETALVLSAEYIALGPEYCAITLSKARIMNEGLALSSAKVDPTWHGCLPIPVTNNSKQEIRLKRGAGLCTLLFFQLPDPIEPEHYLTPDNTPHLGKRRIDYEPLFAVQWTPVNPEKVTIEDMERAVDYGPPFDIIRGMFERSRREVIDYMEKKWAPDTLRDLKRTLWEEEFSQIQKYREKEIELLKQQVDALDNQAKTAEKSAGELKRFHLGLVIGWAIVIVGWILALILLYWKIGEIQAASYKPTNPSVTHNEQGGQVTPPRGAQDTKQE